LLEIVEDKDKSVGTGKSKGLMRSTRRKAKASKVIEASVSSDGYGDSRQS
jgi:hypothetical protein